MVQVDPGVEAQLAVTCFLCVHKGECEKVTLYYERALAFVNEETSKGRNGWKIFEMALT